MADAVASHLPGSLCSIRIEVPGDLPVSIYPGFPAALTSALHGIGIASINSTLVSAPIEQLSDTPEWQQFIRSSGELPYPRYRAVPVVHGSRLTGSIISLFAQDRPDSHAEQKLLESWGRFATLAVERRGLYEQLSFRAQYDSLTTLLNRVSLYERLDTCIRANAADRSPITLIYVDLDSFKQINDNHGHGAGDKVLQHVSGQILQSIRRTDIAARIGGDEFVVVLPGVGDRVEASRIADMLATAIARPLEADGRELRIGASCGISIYPGDGENIDVLLRIADEDMYRVKLAHRELQSRQARGRATDPEASVAPTLLTA